MITQTGRREIARCAVFPDDVDALSWYYMPQSPRVALDDTGKPIFSLVQYRRDVASLSEAERKTKLGGGILTLSVELSATEADIREIRRTLSTDPTLAQRLENSIHRNWWVNEVRKDQAKLAEALKLDSVPIQDGTVGITVLAESPEAGHPDEFVATLVGAGRVSMTGRQRAAFMAKLSVDGAVLLWNMVERNLPAIRIGYDLKYNHRLNAVRMIVTCNARKAFNAVQEQWQRLTDDARWSETHSGNSSHYTFWREESKNARNRMESALTASEATRIEIIPEGGPDVVKPEQIQELTQIGNEMVKDFLAATFLEYKPGAEAKFAEDPELKTELATQNGKKYGHHGIEYYNLKTWNESMSGDLTYDFKSQAVLEGHLAPQDNLSNLLGGRRVEEFRTQIDLEADYYKYLDVQVVCTADFDADPVDLVTARLTYQARGAQGDINETKAMVFRKDTAPGRFSTYLASPELRSYGYEYEVHYKGGADTYKVSGKADGDVLVLDTDRLGVLRVEVQMGLVDWEKIRQVFVKMWYGSGSQRKDTEFTLDAQKQARVWTEVIARAVDQPYGYEVVFVDKNNQRIELEPQTSRSKQLVLNQPIGEELEVVVAPAGAFGELLAQVVVALRYVDQANNYTADDTFTFTKSESKVWKVPLRNKNLRKYDYRVTVFYVDGVIREDEWRTTDKAILASGDPFGYRVQVTPYLIKKPPYAFGTIHLLFEDSQEGIRAEKTLSRSPTSTSRCFGASAPALPIAIPTSTSSRSSRRTAPRSSCRRKRSRRRSWCSCRRRPEAAREERGEPDAGLRQTYYPPGAGRRRDLPRSPAAARFLCHSQCAAAGQGRHRSRAVEPGPLRAKAGQRVRDARRPADAQHLSAAQLRGGTEGPNRACPTAGRAVSARTRRAASPAGDCEPGLAGGRGRGPDRSRSQAERKALTLRLEPVLPLHQSQRDGGGSRLESLGRGVAESACLVPSDRAHETIPGRALRLRCPFRDHDFRGTGKRGHVRQRPRLGWRWRPQAGGADGSLVPPGLDLAGLATNLPM